MTIPKPIDIINDVADSYGVTVDNLRSRCRVARLATARAVTCYLLYKNLNLSTIEVGHIMFRNHASVLHSCRLVEGMYLWPKMYATDLAIIKKIEEKYFSDETMDTVGG